MRVNLKKLLLPRNNHANQLLVHTILLAKPLLLVPQGSVLEKRAVKLPSKEMIQLVL
jgi:hypothetical protein